MSLTRVLVGFILPTDIETCLQTTMQIDARNIDRASFTLTCSQWQRRVQL